MNQKRTFSENMKGAWGLIPMKDKILLCTQSVLSIAILLLVILSMYDVLPARTLTIVALPLLALLLLVNSARNFSKRKFSAVFCIIGAVLILILMGVSLT